MQKRIFIIWTAHTGALFKLLEQSDILQCTDFTWLGVILSSWKQCVIVAIAQYTSKEGVVFKQSVS